MDDTYRQSIQQKCVRYHHRGHHPRKGTRSWPFSQEGEALISCPPIHSGISLFQFSLTLVCSVSWTISVVYPLMDSSSWKTFRGKKKKVTATRTCILVVFCPFLAFQKKPSDAIKMYINNTLRMDGILKSMVVPKIIQQFTVAFSLYPQNAFYSFLAILTIRFAKSQV